MGVALIYITHPDIHEANRVTSHLLEKRLVACANFFPIKSSYWWKGKMKKSFEIVSILKARRENWPKIKAAVKRMHPYEVPCVIKIDAEANGEYETWIKKESSGVEII